MKRVTFCLVCGADAPRGTRTCPACGTPLGPAQTIRPRLRGHLPRPLALLIALAVLAALVALVTFLVT